MTPRHADSEAPLGSQFDQLNAVIGTLDIVDGGYGDSHSTRAVYKGGAGNGYARGIFNVNWRQGDDVWYSAAFYLPSGFKAAMQGQVAIMRWDDYGANPSAAGQGGIVINGNDRRARLVVNSMPSGRQVQVTSSFEVPEGRWFHLEVHQRLGSGNALNEVYLDGNRVTASRTPNMAAGRGADRMRYGVVAVSAGSQTKPLSLRFDGATVSTSRTGARAAQPTSEPARSRRRSQRRRKARYTPRVQKCMGRALRRAERSGNANKLVGAARRCVVRYAKQR